VYVAPVNENKKPVQEKAEFVPCDTVLFSVGLIPENELSKKADVLLSPLTKGPEVDQHMETNVPGVFACGNVVHVNDLVDNVSAESERAGKCAALHARGAAPKVLKTVAVKPGDNVRYVCPQRISVSAEDEEVTLYFRVLSPKRNVVLTASCDGAVLAEKKKFRVNPGEMDHITVHTAKLSGEEVTVSVKEA
ncbi:MAG: FAD-dependent oxidoreductase, partial [Clostridia bacterium]|nr:FAD-dependent oxidoreductase [Clostridia bacterium]